MQDKSSPRFSRRRLLKLGVVSSAGGLAGCSSEDDSPGTTTPEPTTPETTTAETSQQKTSEQQSPTSLDTTLDIGATYRVPPTHRSQCEHGEPAGGNYTELSSDVVTRHAKALRTHGVSRLNINVAHPKHIDAAASLADTLPDDDVAIQFRFDFLSWTSRGTSLETQLEAVADGLARISQYETIDERPVVLLPSLETISFQNDRPGWDELISKYGSGTEVLAAIRSGLTLNDTEPFLLGETRIAFIDWVNPITRNTNPLDELLQEADGIQNGIVNPVYTEGETTDALVDTWRQELLKQMRVLRLFADNYNMAFVPRVVPGFIDSHRGCPPGKYLPRKPDRFRSLLQHAAKYATSNRVAVESFNDWARGTQIEAGSMRQTAYGNTYLEAVRAIATQEPSSVQMGRDVYHVTPDGRDWNPGSESAPLATIQEGLVRAQPGETVNVHPGEYEQQRVQTIRDGREDDPITITGSEDATIRVPNGAFAFWIKNSHIELRGMTFNGLLDPDNPDDVESYSIGGLIQCMPPADQEEYLEDVVVAPAGIGNSQRAMMVFQRTKHLEIGPLRVVGLAGAEYVIGDLQSHVGEIVYLGQPPRVIEGREHEKYNYSEYPWQGELDQTRHVHIHHIDNSEGHAHSQIVNTKTGTRDVLVEYCTDAGGSFNTEPWNKCADIRFQSYDATLRWCELHDGDEHAIQIGDPNRGWLSDHEYSISAEVSGTAHSIYGNTIDGFGEKTLQIDTTAEEQDTLCGNEITGSADGDLGQACPRDVPEGDGRGHLGGDSPWSEG